MHVFVDLERCFSAQIPRREILYTPFEQCHLIVGRLRKKILVDGQPRLTFTHTHTRECARTHAHTRRAGALSASPPLPFNSWPSVGVCIVGHRLSNWVPNCIVGRSSSTHGIDSGASHRDATQRSSTATHTHSAERCSEVAAPRCETRGFTPRTLMRTIWPGTIELLPCPSDWCAVPP